MSTKIKAEDFELTKENKNFKQAEITRHNMTSTFTIADLEQDVAGFDKIEREANGQLRVSKAVIDNVERNHEFISKLSDEQLSVAAYLYEAKRLVKESEQRLKDVKKAKKQYADILSVVHEKFGFVATKLPADEQS